MEVLTETWLFLPNWVWLVGVVGVVAVVVLKKRD